MTSEDEETPTTNGNDRDVNQTNNNITNRTENVINGENSNAVNTQQLGAFQSNPSRAGDISLALLINGMVSTLQPLLQPPTTFKNNVPVDAKPHPVGQPKVSFC